MYLTSSCTLLFNVTRMCNVIRMEVISKIREFNVPVPWGHIAVKAWGDEANTAVLVVHGRMDNAGSFDCLLPFLPKSFYYICVDLPGHGKSSHFPAFVPLYTLSYVPVYKLLMQHFQRKSCIIMGHSYGAQLGFLFAQLYPNYVEKLIMLDAIHTFPVAVRDFKEYLVDKFDNNIELQEKFKTGTPPTYTYEEALERLVSGRENSELSIEAAKALLCRSIEPTADGRYKFTLDYRMKCYIDPLHDFRYAIESMKYNPVTCPILIILGRDSQLQQAIMKPIIQVLEKWENVSIKVVNGDHDVHNNDPEIVAPHINTFLLQQKGKL